MTWRQPHWLIGGPLPEELAKTEQYIGQVAAVMEDMTTQEISHHYQITVGFVLHVLEQIAKLKTVEFEKQFRAPTRPLTAEEIAELTRPRDRTMDTIEVKPLRQHCPPMSEADLRFIIENDLLSFPEACKQIGFTQCALSQQMKKKAYRTGVIRRRETVLPPRRPGSIERARRTVSQKVHRC